MSASINIIGGIQDYEIKSNIITLWMDIAVFSPDIGSDWKQIIVKREWVDKKHNTLKTQNEASDKYLSLPRQDIICVLRIWQFI